MHRIAFNTGPGVLNERKEPVPDPKKYNMQFRPKSYWEEYESVISSIKGAFRQAAVRQAADSGQIEQVPEHFFAPSLPDAIREISGAIHPQLMGGEYLPDFKEGEVEIARATLDSTTTDVISIRARHTIDKIHYQIVNEYYDRPNPMGYLIQPAQTDRPLTMAQLIDLIDGVKLIGEKCDMRGLTTIYREFNCDEGYWEMWNFVSITSDYYPQLGSWYDDEAREWYDKMAELHRDPDDPDRKIRFRRGPDGEYRWENCSY